MDFGFLLPPVMIRILRIVFALSPEPDLSDELNMLDGVENWRLYRELFSFVKEIESTAGHELDSFVLVELFLETMNKETLSYPQWQKMKAFMEYHAEKSSVNIETIRVNVNDPKKTFYKDVFGALSKQEVLDLIDMEETQCKEELLKRFPYISKSYITPFYQSAFAQENGYAAASLYWAFVNGEINEEPIRAIRQQSLYRVKEAIRSRLLRTCMDGCPSCLHNSSDIVSRSMLSRLVSRRLLSEFLEGLWKSDNMLIDVREEQALTELQMLHMIRGLFEQGIEQLRLWHFPSQIEVIHKAIGKLIADGVEGASHNKYGINIADFKLRDLDFINGVTYEITLSLQERLDNQ
ncbi:hypothetical protein D3C75_698700 [compost metagenome]